MDHTKPQLQFYNAPFTADSFNGMPYRVLGKSGLRVSTIGLGTWKMGYAETGDGSRVDDKTAWQIFDRAIELGVTFWDTANRYNNASGNSERIIGIWLKNNPDQRRNVVLATKMFGGMDGLTPNHSRLSRGNILDSVYASLQRMRVDYIDVLYFHGYDATTPAEESLAAVEDLIRRDLVRYFAVSNFTVDQLRIHLAAAEGAFTRCRPLAVQNGFDILHGELNQAGVLDFAARAGVSFVAFSPLGRGLLTERYLEPAKAGKGDRLVDEGTLEADLAGGVKEKLSRLATLARQWELPLNHLALAYMLTLPGMGPVIPSASTVAQLESNAGAGKVVLQDEQVAQIRTALRASS